MMPQRSQLSFRPYDRPVQSLSNVRCQTILYKAIMEHFPELYNIAALLLASKSFQNSSFGANFLVNFMVNNDTIALLKHVLSPSSCFSLQFIPSLCLDRATPGSAAIEHDIEHFVAELVGTKYFASQLGSLSLKYVTFQATNFFFGNSTQWPNLQSLEIGGDYSVDERAFAPICKFAVHLSSLKMDGTSGINDECLRCMASLTCITDLNLSACTKITDAGLEHVSKLSTIVTIDLSHCGALSDAGLHHIFELTNIRRLFLGYCLKLGDASLEHISNLVNLNFLSLYCNFRIGDVGMSHVSKCSQITNLNVAGCTGIGDIGLQHLSCLSLLTVLHLGGCSSISDAGLEHLSGLSGIVTLGLAGCERIGDAGLGYISKLPRLASVDVYRCDHITDEAKTKFRIALPNCDLKN